MLTLLMLLVFGLPSLAKDKRTFAGTDGRFTLSGIAPGRYRILALEELDPDSYRDPKFLSRFLERSHRINIAAGESITAKLKKGGVQ